MSVRTSKGFTIIEVLMALAIFGIGILAVAKMQISSTGYNTSSRVYTEAAAEGAGQIEELINQDYEDLSGDSVSDVGPNNMYNVEWKVMPAVILPGGNVNVRRIDVTVTQDKNPDREFNATYYKAIDF